MFTRLRVRNFRSIRDSGDVKLSGLNIFVGPNNSGKSSLLYSLLLLKQTLEDKDLDMALVTVGRHVDLGSYLDIIPGHDPQQELDIRFELNPAVLPELGLLRAGALRPLSPRPFNECRVRFGFERAANRVSVAAFELRDTRSRWRYRGELAEGQWIFDGSGIGEQLKPHLTPMFRHFLPYVGIKGKKPRSDAVARQCMELSLSTQMNANYIDRLFDKVLYVGPVRERIPRYSMIGTMPYTELGPSGQNLMRVLSRVRADGRSTKTVMDRLNYWLDKKFKILRNVQIRDVDEGGTVKALLADDRRGHQMINLAAMGSGLSQLVPVVVQTVLTPPDGCLIVEQPEIHLHPAAQANLGDLFVWHARHKRQVIVETHSEHLLLRVRRRVAEGRISPDMVRIFFVEKPGAETRIRPLELEPNGHFVRWPRDFFEEGYREALAIAEAQPT